MRYSAAASRGLTDNGVRQLVASYTGRYAAVIDDFKMQPGMIYTQVRAISARINQNYDAWPSEELKKSFRTFLGKPVFVNHQNFDPEKARGRVVAARYREAGNDKYVEVIQEIDAVRFPKLAKEIHEGGMDSVSMGVEAGFTKCSVCDNKATDISDMCDHVKHHKGETLRHAKTGEPTLVYENCFKLGFFELSYVFDPADETAVVSRVVVANRRHGEQIGDIDPDTIDPMRGGGFDAGYGDFQPQPLDSGIAGGGMNPARAFTMATEPVSGTFIEDKNSTTGSSDPQAFKTLAWNKNQSYIPTREELALADAKEKKRLEKKKNRRSIPDRILDDLERDKRLRKLREFLRVQPEFLTANRASEVDWSDIGRQAYDRGDSDTADENPDVADALKGLNSQEADFVRGRYEQGYDMAKRHALRRYAAAYEEDENKTMSTMKDLTPGDMTGMPSAPTQYNLTPGEGWVNPGGGGGGSSSGGGTSGGGGGSSSSGGGVTGDGSARDFAHSMMPHWENQGFTVGDHEADQYGEHQNGALDVMVPDIESGDRVLQQALQDPNVHGLIWNNQVYGYGNGADPSPYSAGNTGNATQDHMDHVHIWYQPGGNNIMRAANRRYAWGETEAPEDIDTLREQSEDDGSDDFHHYVDSPEELSTPDFDQAKRLDRAQEDAGLDADRRVEDVEEVGIPTRKGGRKMPRYRYAEDMGSAPVDPSMMGGDPSMGQPALDPNLGQMGPEQELALLNQAQGDLAYAESELYGGGPVDPSMGGDMGAESQPYAEGEPEEEYEEEEQPVNPSSVPPQIEARYRTAKDDQQAYVEFCKKNGCDPSDPGSIDYFIQGTTENFWTRPSKGKKRPVRNTASQKKERRIQKGRSMGINLSERGKVASRGRRLHADESGHVDGGPYGRNDQGAQEEIFLSQTPAEEALVNPTVGDSISNTENTLVARVQRGTDQLRRDAAALARLRQKKVAGEHSLDTAGPDAVNPYTGGSTFGPIDVTVGEPTAPSGPQHAAANKYASLCRQAGVRPTQQGFRRFLAGDNIVEPTTVNPDLSGTDDQSLKGDDFDSIALDNVATQPKDASIHAFAAFDDWLARSTGKTARQHGNANFIRREAARYIRATGVPLGNLFPTLEKVLVEARKAETTREATMNRKANESLETAAPMARADVEAPVKDVTDADAQASQYDLSDYGSNAGDNLADPDLSTDSQFWAPGGGEKTSNRTADAVAAVRCAEAYINAGLAPSSEKWKLIARFQTMRHATVVDRTRLLEAKNDVDRSAANRQRSAAVSRGTSIPRGLGSGQRTAQTNRIAANDPSSDSLLFFK
jgi:hypothetical protein